MRDTPELPLTGEKRQALETMISATTNNLLRQSPQNPSARALVAKQTGLWIPDNLTTYKQVREWLECQTMDLRNTPQPAKGAAREIEIAVNGVRAESGRCRYTANTNTRGHVRVTAQQLAEIAEDASDLDEFQIEVANLIQARAEQADFDWQIHYGSLQTERYEETETNDTQFTWEMQQVGDAAFALLQANYPAMARRLQE